MREFSYRDGQSSARLPAATPEPKTVALFGEYDLSRRPELAAQLGAIDGNEPLLLDIGEVTYLDSSFLNELAILRRRLPGCEIVVKSANARFRRLLGLFGFDRMFRVLD